jgi:hypothetical protein
MRQELDVDWGFVTNGRSFEVLTKGDDGRQEEISLIQFDLDDLRERPDLLKILSKESIQSGKSDEIANQIAQAGEAILHLQENKERVAKDLNEFLSGEIGSGVPLDIEAQATEFVDDLISALEEQRRAIGTTSPHDENEPITPDADEIQDTKGEYVINIRKSDTKLATFADDTQSDAMADAVNYLIEDHSLISEIEPLPYIPGREKAIINDTPTSPHDDEAMRAYRELSYSSFLDTHDSKEGKKRTLFGLAEKCRLEAEFEGGW